MLHVKWTWPNSTKYIIIVISVCLPYLCLRLTIRQSVVYNKTVSSFGPSSWLSTTLYLNTCKTHKRWRCSADHHTLQVSTKYFWQYNIKDTTWQHSTRHSTLQYTRTLQSLMLTLHSHAFPSPRADYLRPKAWESPGSSPHSFLSHFLRQSLISFAKEYHPDSFTTWNCKRTKISIK